MPTESDHLLAAVRATAVLVRDAEALLMERRAATHKAIMDADAGGVSVAAIARAYGVTGERVRQIIARARRPAGAR